MSILLADIDATCSNLGSYKGNKYCYEDNAIQSIKHLIWILRRDNQDSHEYRRYIGHKKVIETDLLPMVASCGRDSELSEALIRLLVNLTNPTLLFFREDLPKDGAGRRTYLDLVEISHTYKDAFAKALPVWEYFASRLQKILNTDVGDRMEEQSLLLERVLVLTRNVLQVPTNPQHEKQVDNDISVHDQVLWGLNKSGMFELILYILSSEYENQFHLHALEITFLIFREQKVATLADASVQRTAAEKHADEQKLLAARRLEKAKIQQRLPPARHSRFGGTYVYKNLKSVSDERDLICHQSYERIMQKDFNRDKQKVKSNFRLARDDDKYERQSAFCIRIFLREFCIEILTSAFNNLVRQVRRVLERNHGIGESSGHDQSYLLWAMRFFLEFNRLTGFKLHLVTETLSTGSVHWICTQIQNDAEMIQTDKKKKIKWNRRLQLGIQAYREFLLNLQVMELEMEEDTQALLGKLKNNMFYVVEYREIILHLLLSYNENNFTRIYLRDLIDTTNVFLKMMEKYCQGSIVVQTKVKSKPKGKSKTKRKKTTVKPKKAEKASKEEVLAKLSNEWDGRISANLSVVLVNDINLPEDEHPVPFDATAEKAIDEQSGDCMTRVHKFLRDEDFERAVLLLRAGRACWTETECFGAQNAQPEDELLLMKEIYFADLGVEDDQDDVDAFWDELENSESDNEESADSEDDADDEEGEGEETTVLKEVVLNFADFEKRLLNPKVVRACTWCLQTWEEMNQREIKSTVTLLHRLAVNLEVPVMLMQAQLFRLFQQVFNAPRDNRYEELRRLGIFVVRQFVKLAPTNPKIFAELLFFKSSRDCYEVAHGYSDSMGGHETKQKIWTEEQEEELQRLFMENQESPQTDQDVIDWILDNLIEKSRTRRAVIKKLKELGLIFKAPTKKSNANALNRRNLKEKKKRMRGMDDEVVRQYEEDDKMSELSDVDEKQREMSDDDDKRSEQSEDGNKSRELPDGDETPRELPDEKPTDETQKEDESDDSSDDDLTSSVRKAKKKVLESSDEDDELPPTKRSSKRDRSDDETPDENEMNANNQFKRIRKIVDSSDDE